MIVITGANGNIGSKITETLLAQKQKVRCVGRSADKLHSFAAKGAETAIGTLEDTAFLTKAFSGASAVFALIPPSYAEPNFRAYQARIGSSIAEAIRKSNVKHAVNLSSQGAHLPEKTGPIKGLHDQEERLDKIENVHVLHLRPAYFMENLLASVDMIKTKHIVGSAIRGDLVFPMIATKDIAKFAAERLSKRDFSGKSVRDLLGQRDLSLDVAAAIIAQKIKMPGLRYVQFPYEDTEKALVGMGLSQDVSELMVEMAKAFNEGLIGKVPRTRQNTTETSFEAFADVFIRLLAS
jgi:uncharacterized protein YbjT (DUF2867 family)